ncbi:hypothetical protein [Methylomagnum sp.]
MQHELTITAPNQSGFFAKIMMAVRRRGCQMVGQRRDVQGDTQIVTLIISGADALTMALAEDIESIGSAVKATVTAHPEVVHVGRQALETGLTTPAAPRSAFLSKLVKDHPNLEDLVKQAEAERDEEATGNILVAIGDRVGRREYARHYALGSPLKLQSALPRMVVPAMKQFVNATAEDEMVVIPACSFCNRDPAQGKSCGFLQGFISGLLRSAPTTSTVTVVQSGCALKGHASCRFEMR